MRAVAGAIVVLAGAEMFGHGTIMYSAPSLPLYDQIMPVVAAAFGFCLVVAGLIAFWGKPKKRSDP
jgi:hypothetical protein